MKKTRNKFGQLTLEQKLYKYLYNPGFDQGYTEEGLPTFDDNLTNDLNNTLIQASFYYNDYDKAGKWMSNIINKKKPLDQYQVDQIDTFTVGSNGSGSVTAGGYQGPEVQSVQGVQTTEAQVYEVITKYYQRLINNNYPYDEQTGQPIFALIEQDIKLFSKFLCGEMLKLLSMDPTKLEEYKQAFVYYLTNTENELYKKYGNPYGVDFRKNNRLTTADIQNKCNEPGFGKRRKKIKS